MKKAYITVHNEVLRGMLMVPETVKVESVVANGKDGFPNTFIACLSGDGLPEFTEIKEGETVKQVTLQYEKVTEEDNLVPNVQHSLKEIKKV